MCYSINNAHMDWINDLEVSQSQNFLYSGGKDGAVKVYGQAPEEEGKLQFLANLQNGG